MATKGVDPLVVARRIPRAIARNQAVLKVPFHAVAVAWLFRLFPGLYERMARRTIQGKWFPIFT